MFRDDVSERKPGLSVRSRRRRVPAEGQSEGYLPLLRVGSQGTSRAHARRLLSGVGMEGSAVYVHTCFPFCCCSQVQRGALFVHMLYVYSTITSTLVTIFKPRVVLTGRKKTR